MILSGWYVYHTNKVDPAHSFSVTLYTPEQQLLAQETGDPQDASLKSLVGMFYSIATSTESTKAFVGDLDTKPYILADLTLNGVTSQWKCYFSLREIDSFCVSADGTVYPIDGTVSRNFLASPYAEPFYETAKPPTLITLDNESVTPLALEWFYQSNEGSFLQAVLPQTTDQNILYEITGELGFTFSQTPDLCSVQVWNSEGEKIFHDSYSELSSLTTAVGDVLTVRINANWNANDRGDPYGTAEYHFSVRIRNQSAFSIHTDTVRPGEAIVLSCTNITTLSKINFTAHTPDCIPAPVFHRDGDHVRALLIFPESITQKQFAFTVSYGASKQSFTVSIQPSEQAPQYSYSELDFSQNPAAETAARDELLQLLTALPSNDTFPYFRGNFSDPTKNGFAVGYTHNGTVAWGSSLSQSFTALGTELIATETSDRTVRALHNGRVLAVGNSDLLGRYVVIDHGCGLRTWYGHLSMVSVSVGEVVKQDDPLGKVGRGGASTADGFLLICTAYDTVLDPSFIIGKELPLENLIP